MSCQSVACAFAHVPACADPKRLLGAVVRPHTDGVGAKAAGSSEHLAVRIADDGIARLEAIAAGQSSPRSIVTRSDLIREAVSRWLAKREDECGWGHRGPAREGRCLHCGKPQ